MILLLGGTSETPQIANLMAQHNVEVLISNLTEGLINWDMSSGVRIRHGALDVDGICKLIIKECITTMVDAAHPYAEELHTTAIEACSRTNIPYLRYERPSVNYSGYDVVFANDHQRGAGLAFGIGRNALLTTGSRNLEHYVNAAMHPGSKLYVRVLPCKESRRACRDFGIDETAIIAEHGPFTIEQNQELIKKYSIDVLVTKDSGLAGGVLEKLEAARLCGVKVVVVRKPISKQIPRTILTNISELIENVIRNNREIFI
jgi:precorrin-6A/cobalt-precorrin-6A reductase